MSSTVPTVDVRALAAEAAERVRREARELVPDEPFAGVGLRVLRALGVDCDPGPLLRFWASRDPGSARGEMRYRWDLSHRHVGTRPAYLDPPDSWRAFRPLEQQALERDVFAFEERLCTPILLAENAALLAEITDPAVAPLAASLLQEALPAIRHDFARHVQALDPWEDTFALARLTDHPALLARMHPIAVAIASCYGAAALDDDGALLGLRFPFHRKPLVSASAQLAGSALALGIDLERASRLLAYVSAARRPDGLWGDEPDCADLLATLAAAELLVTVDPSFDLAPTLSTLVGLRTAHGLWTALGPETLWLSARVLALIALAQQPFAQRFRWPYQPEYSQDLKTRLATFAFFADLTRFLAAVPALASAPLELAFIDLIGFRTFNNRFGQQRGDDVLRAFATALTAVPAARIVRDGGDEFLVIGAPTRGDLVDDLESFRTTWPARFRELFGTEISLVAPRIVVGQTTGGELASAREAAGRAITELKAGPQIPEDGIVRGIGAF